MSRIKLTVAVTATWTTSAAIETVGSINGTQPPRDDVEILVVSDPGRVNREHLPDGTKWIVAESHADVPRLRRLAVDRASGEVVAFLEDACVVRPGWLAAVLSAFEDHSLRAVTGPVVQHEPSSATDHAVYFAEYAAFGGRASRRPRHERPFRKLAGINFAVRRSWLDGSGPIREVEIARACPQGSIALIDAAEVYHRRTYSPCEALRDRWDFGRVYGRERWAVPGMCSNIFPSLCRVGRVAAPLILAAQMARLVATLRDRPSEMIRLLTCAHVVLPLLAAWSWGEATGWADAARVSR